jgi:hypothetical protein
LVKGLNITRTETGYIVGSELHKLHVNWIETQVENKTEAKVEKIDPAEVRGMRAMARSMRYIVDG